MLNDWADGFILFWVVDLMRTRTQFGIFIAMKMDVNQFIYRENLRPTMLDNSHYPHRTPASTFCNFAYGFFLRRHHHHRICLSNYFLSGWPIFFIFRWYRRNFAVFYKRFDFVIIAAMERVYGFTYIQGEWRMCWMCACVHIKVYILGCYQYSDTHIHP